MQARCLLFEFQRRRYRAEAPTVGRNVFFNRLLASSFGVSTASMGVGESNYGE